MIVYLKLSFYWLYSYLAGLSLSWYNNPEPPCDLQSDRLVWVCLVPFIEEDENWQQISQCKYSKPPHFLLKHTLLSVCTD